MKVKFFGILALMLLLSVGFVAAMKCCCDTTADPPTPSADIGNDGVCDGAQAGQKFFETPSDYYDCTSLWAWTKCKNLSVPEFGSDSTAYYLTIIGIVAVVAVAFIAMRKK